MPDAIRLVDSPVNLNIELSPVITRSGITRSAHGHVADESRGSRILFNLCVVASFAWLCQFHSLVLKYEFMIAKQLLFPE